MLCINRLKKRFSSPLCGDYTFVKKGEKIYVTKQNDSGEEEKRSEVVKIDTFSFMKNEYLKLLIISFLLVLVSFLLIRSLFLDASIILMEIWAYFQLQKKPLLDKSKTYFKYLFILIGVELTFFVGILMFDMKIIIFNNEILSSLFLLNFYLYIRLYVLSLFIKFRTVYKIVDSTEKQDGYYVWVSQEEAHTKDRGK